MCNCFGPPTYRLHDLAHVQMAARPLIQGHTLFLADNSIYVGHRAMQVAK